MSHEETVQPNRKSRQADGIAIAAHPEVSPKAMRRRFTAGYKLRILAEAEACTKPGEIGSLLRREGLYHSHLDKWWHLRRSGSLHALSPQKRGAETGPAGGRDHQAIEECSLPLGTLHRYVRLRGRSVSSSRLAPSCPWDRQTGEDSSSPKTSSK